METILPVSEWTSKETGVLNSVLIKVHVHSVVVTD